MRRALPVLAATLLVAAGAGCSGDDEASGTTVATMAATTTTATTTEPSETRPEPADDQSRWARQVDAACEPWQEQLDALAPPASAADLDAFLGEALPLIREQIAAVEAVEPPTDPARKLAAARFVGQLRAVEQALTRYRAALAQNDAAAVQEALAAASTAGAAARAAAQALDVTACGGYATN